MKSIEAPIRHSDLRMRKKIGWISDHVNAVCPALSVTSRERVLILAFSGERKNDEGEPLPVAVDSKNKSEKRDIA